MQSVASVIANRAPTPRAKKSYQVIRALQQQQEKIFRQLSAAEERFVLDAIFAEGKKFDLKKTCAENERKLRANPEAYDIVVDNDGNGYLVELDSLMDSQ